MIYPQGCFVCEGEGLYLNGKILKLISLILSAFNR